MASTGLDVFDQAVQQINEWLREIGEQLYWEDRKDAYSALRATLLALRDRLTVDEAAHFADQLPMLARGIFYEGWKPARNPGRERTEEEFLANVQANLRYDIRMDVRRIVPAVFSCIARHLDGGEIDHVILQLPESIRRVLITGNA